MELAKAAAEGVGGGHPSVPRTVGEGGMDERREEGEVEEDLEQEVLAKRVDSGGAR